MIFRATETIAKTTAFVVELNFKKTFAFGAEEEGFQRLIDAVNSAIEAYNGGYSSLSSDSNHLSEMASSVQQQIASFLTNPLGGMQPQTVFEQPPTDTP